MITILEYAVRNACTKFGHNSNIFSTANFQSAFSKLTNTTPMMTSSQAEAILLSLPYVLSDSKCFWKYQNADI